MLLALSVAVVLGGMGDLTHSLLVVVQTGRSSMEWNSEDNLVDSVIGKQPTINYNHQALTRGLLVLYVGNLSL